MNRNAATDGRIVEFLRKRDYKFVRELGQGACGKTVLLRDELLGEDFVCKKYVPYDEAQRETLFKGFLNEIRLLLKAHHPNVVRVYNYFLYPEHHAGYILMEYVDGTEINQYLQSAPERATDVFIEAIQGFSYLESNRILHRDIRPANIMVTYDGITKIIDLGFGKRVDKTQDFDRSISLNWWCEPPKDFSSRNYDFCTEVYFVGKLFEKLLQQNDIQEFKYMSLLRRMCNPLAADRVQSFADVAREIQEDLFIEIDFSLEEKQAYRQFANEVCGHVTKICTGSAYVNDLDAVQLNLENEYRKSMLNVDVPDAAKILNCMLRGAYYYQKEGLKVATLKAFIQLLKSMTAEKRRIVFSNLHTRLDAIPRYEKDDQEDIPF